MTQRSHKNISVHDGTYEILKHMGAVTESFDDVIQRLIQKAASAQDSFEGTKGKMAAAPL